MHGAADASGRVLVRGALCLAVGQACVNLNFFIDATTSAMLAQLDPGDWYPMPVYLDLLRVVADRYTDPAPILERIGMEIIRIWAVDGVEQVGLRRGVDFLRFQTSSAGYYSVVRGSPEQIGTFALTNLDEQRGRAVIRSTTPFPKDVERGILLGGLQLFGDLAYVDVDNSADPQRFVIEFH